MKSKISIPNIHRQQILNIKIDSLSINELLKSFSSGIMFTPNVDHLVRLQRDKDFYLTYKSADFVVCDSRIVFFMSKFLGRKIKETIPGSEFFPHFCNYHKNNEDIRVFLLGAGPGIAVEAMNRINNKIGRKIIVGAHSPSYGFEKKKNECQEIIKTINKTSANVLVVGVGSPKQENWIVTYKRQFEQINQFLALGATIDFEAGTLKRAPKSFQKLGIEWLYRLLKEPQRLWRRYLIDDIPFFGYIIKQKLGLYKNPFSFYD